MCSCELGTGGGGLGPSELLQATAIASATRPKNSRRIRAFPEEVVTVSVAIRAPPYVVVRRGDGTPRLSHGDAPVSLRIILLRRALEQPLQPRTGDAEAPRRLGAVVAGGLQRGARDGALNLGQRAAEGHRGGRGAARRPDGELAQGERAGRRQQHRALDRVAQLADVAGP